VTATLHTLHSSISTAVPLYSWQFTLLSA